MNKVFLLGNIGTDPELKVLNNGTSLLKFSLATNKSFKDKDGEKKQLTEWHRVTFFGKQAEGLAKYLAKGKQVLVEGEIRTSSYEKDGEKRYSTEIVGNQLEFVNGGKKSEDRTEEQSDGTGGDEEIPY